MVMGVLYFSWVDRCSKQQQKKKRFLTFNITIKLRMVLGLLVEWYHEVFSHILPLLWCRVLKEISQVCSELKTDEWRLNV